MAGYPGGSRLVGAGVFGGRQDTVALEELHQDDKASMVRPQRVAARDLPFTDNHGIFNMFGRPRTSQKKGLLRHELNAAMNERLNDHHAQAQRGAQQMARRGLQLSIEVLAEGSHRGALGDFFGGQRRARYGHQGGDGRDGRNLQHFVGGWSKGMLLKSITANSRPQTTPWSA